MNINQKMDSLAFERAVEYAHERQIENLETVQPDRAKLTLTMLVHKLYLRTQAICAMGLRVNEIIDKSDYCTVCEKSLKDLPATKRNLNFGGNTSVIVGGFCEDCAKLDAE